MHKYCVFARHFSLLYLFLICLSQRIDCQVSKCCSDNFVLDIESDHFCESSANQTDWHAYNLPISAVFNCSDVRNVFVGDVFYIELNGCIDQNANGQLMTVACPRDAVHSGNGVHLINKCCPPGHSYDYSQRFCRKDENSYVRFEKIFGEAAVVFKNNVPNCSANEVFVEYISTAHAIRFDGTNLKVGDDTLLSNKFCIDNLVNIDSGGFNEHDSHIIVRSCRSPSVCAKIPCMRRCCKVDQVMEPRPEGYKICQNHPNKMNLQPTFYNVALPLDTSQKQAYIKGMDEVLLEEQFIKNSCADRSQHQKTVLKL